ncbi:MAG: aldehyde dehydrogenase family protein [Thiolinea sp.]
MGAKLNFHAGIPMRQIEHFIAGEFTASANGKRFDKRSPLTNQVIASIAEGGKAEIDAAVVAARQALHGEWGAMTPETRVDLL